MKGVIRATRGKSVVEYYYHTKEEARNLVEELTKYRKAIIEFIPELSQDFSEIFPGGYNPEIAESIFKSRCKIIHYEERVHTGEGAHQEQRRRCTPCHWLIVVCHVVDRSIFATALQKVI
ncbi:hypothetical protein SAMN05428988_0112 [Chitinophaga sp. YR573]|nr:hypothetical protein SAMN05428988_0112 [Chitinophaga sp. YR573]